MKIWDKPVQTAVLNKTKLSHFEGINQIYLPKEILLLYLNFYEGNLVSILRQEIVLNFNVNKYIYHFFCFYRCHQSV